MADTVLESNNPTVTTPQSTETQSSRDSVLAKYNQLYGGESGGEAANDSGGDSTAQVTNTESTVVTSTSTQTAQPTQTDEDETANQLLEYISNLVKKVESLESRLGNNSTQPKTEETKPTEEKVKGKWIQLLADGKIEEAEAAMREALGVKTVDEQAIRTEAARTAMEQIKAQQRIDDINNNIRKNNPELVKMESFIGSRLQASMQDAVDSGKIKNPSDYVQFYETSLNKLVDEARGIIQEFRAAGAQQATVVKKEVLSSQTLPPNSVTNREPAKSDDTEVDDSPLDYFEKRKQLMLRQRGMAI